MLEKIVTGGQTGVDRAALDAAMDLNIEYGGWCPKGRIDELGTIPRKYNQLTEISISPANEKENYDTRTIFNIRDSDGTLIIVPKLPLSESIKDGTVLTIQEVSKQNKPYLLISLSSLEDNVMFDCIEWIRKHDINILNIAGPRESNSSGIYKNSYNFLSNLLTNLILENKLVM